MTKEAEYKKACAWVIGHDHGTSSESIWAVMMGVPFGGADVPYDPDDFGRCYRLLSLIPSWRGRLHLVGRRYPAWRKFVAVWDELERLWQEESPDGTCPRLYARMQQIRGVR